MLHDSMHVYLCACACVPLCMCMCTFVHVHVYLCACACVPLCMCMCTFVHVHVYLCACACVPLCMCVKNGFSDLTKVQIGRDWPRKDVGCERQGKALEEGCREREAARKSVSSTEKINTKENLARATAKPRARHRQSLQDMSVGFQGEQGSNEHLNVGDHIG